MPAAWHCALLLMLSPAAFAQDDANLPNLLFEPVVINIIEAAENTDDAPYTVQELTTLPHDAPAVPLQNWLAQRNTAPTLPPEQIAADIAKYEQSVLAQENSGG